MKKRQNRDWLLELLALNEEFLVIVNHQFAMNTSLPFVHTARRSYRLGDPVNYMEWHCTIHWFSWHEML